MKNNLISAAKVVGMIAFSCFISFFVYISFFVVIRQIATDVTGYQIYEIVVVERDENGNAIKTENRDIETVETPPAKKDLGENRGYRELRSKMPMAANITLSVLQVICGVGVVFCTAGAVLAKDAAKDRNDTDFNEAKPDKLRGLKIGALAAVPSSVLYLLALVLRLVGESPFTSAYYWFFRWGVMCPVKPIVDLMTGNAATLHDAPVWSVAVQGVFSLFIIAFCAVMYIICYNEDSVIAKVLYKSTRKKEKKQRRL